MKIYCLLWSLVTVCLWCACSGKEDSLEPSHRDGYWMVVQNDPGEWNQVRYKLYKDYGIPVFVNDTIGSEQRGYDAYGQPIIYYEMLWPGYSMAGNANFSFRLSSDTTEMIKVVEMIYKWVAPNLFEDIAYKPASYFLCDQAYKLSGDSKDSTCRVYDIYASLKTTTLSINGIKGMNQDELKDIASRMVGTATFQQVVLYYGVNLNPFYEISKEGFGENENPYGEAIDYGTFVFPEGWKEEKLYLTGGFLHERYLNYRWEVNSSGKKLTANVPDQSADVEDYVGAVMVYSESEFEQLYGKYDKMMRKFRFMKEKVAFYKTEVLKE